ncbi:MAG TPA: TPM domain-containing protein, partial [Candidatus Corynebacterium gallistercoris]|nr:TPM domain-containing protein [Candidatus Corynebacterium gallistercoris]
MNQNFLPRFSASFAVAALAAFSPVFVGDATAAQPLPTTHLVAQGVALSSQLVDDADVIDDSKEADIASKLKEGISESQMKVYLVYTTDTPSGAKATAEELRTQDGTANVAVFVVNPEARQQGMAVGDSIKTADATDLAEKANKHYADDDFTAGAETIADEVSNTASTASKVWMGAGATALVGGGAAAFAWSRRNQKKNEAEQLDTARSIAPEATTDLAQQPIDVLRTLAEEELRSTDESIRKGEQELSVAESEFGAARTAELSKALRHSRNTLNKAYGMHQRVRSGMVSGDHEVRGLLVEIISSCGTADKNLNAQSEKFEKLRQELIDAPQQLEKLVQMTVSLRSRIPGAQAILADLKSRVDDHLVASVEHNPEVAESEIDEAEKHIATARELVSKPAGQQGGLVDALGAARMAIQQADSQLVAVEHAEEQLR